NYAGILTRPLHHALATRRQTLQMHARRFVRAVLTPHHAEDAKFGERGFAAAEKLLDLLVFIGREAVLPEDFRRKGRDQGSSHGKRFYCRIWRDGWVGPTPSFMGV